MKKLQFNPQIFTVKIDTFHGEVSFDLLTLDGMNPAETIYFFAKGDLPSSNEKNQIDQAVESGNWEVSNISGEEMIRNYDIDVTIFDGNDSYDEIIEELNRLQSKY